MVAKQVNIISGAVLFDHVSIVEIDKEINHLMFFRINEWKLIPLDETLQSLAYSSLSHEKAVAQQHEIPVVRLLISIAALFEEKVSECQQRKN